MIDEPITQMGANGRIILKWVLQQRCVLMWIGFSSILTAITHQEMATGPWNFYSAF